MLVCLYALRGFTRPSYISPPPPSSQPPPVPDEDEDRVEATAIRPVASIISSQSSCEVLHGFSFVGKGIEKSFFVRDVAGFHVCACNRCLITGFCNVFSEDVLRVFKGLVKGLSSVYRLRNEWRCIVGGGGIRMLLCWSLLDPAY